MSNKFIHFGCWNKGLCSGEPPEKSALSKVMSKLRERVGPPSTDVKFIIVAGDNYYPDKIEIRKDVKRKIVVSENLTSGFSCLPTEIPINMIMGNHDLETNTSGESILYKEAYVDEEQNKEPLNECFILKQQIAAANPKANIDYVIYKALLFENNLIIMIDTSMYDEDTSSFIGCYKDKNDSANIESMNKLRKQQYDFVMNEISEKTGAFTNVIVVGHHPITGIKAKKKVENERAIKAAEEKGEKPPEKIVTYKLKVENYMPKFVDLWKAIKEKVGRPEPEVNYYYLCADVHMYQKGEVNIKNADETVFMKIDQYIVGTGGADLDDNPYKKIAGFSEPYVNRDVTQSESGAYNYIIEYKTKNEDINESYGYLECASEGETVAFNFIPVEFIKEKKDKNKNPEPAAGGQEAGAKAKKTRRKKTSRRKSRKVKRGRRN